MQFYLTWQSDSMTIIVINYYHFIFFKGLANNNRSDVVLKLFKEGVEQYMLPSRVRGDMGGENVQVADYMIRHRGVGRGSYLTGSSRFNTR